MSKVSYVVDLNDRDRQNLLNIVVKEKSNTKQLLHANTLLAADINNPDKASAPVIAERFHTHRQTVQTVRKTCATRGLEAALERKKRTKPPGGPKFTDDAPQELPASIRPERGGGVSKGTLMTTDLWAWTRHPNYFGEAVLW